MKNNFESNLSELENIIKKLESNDTTLEESILLFEKGIKLSGECKTALNNAESKIIALSDAEGEQTDD